MNTMTSREAFEEWYEVDCYPCEHSNWFRLDSDGDYEFDEVQYAWRTWQAATDAEAVAWVHADGLSAFGLTPGTQSVIAKARKLTR